MKFEYQITTGHYNWANEREKTVYIRILIVNEKEEKLTAHLHLPIDDEGYWKGRFKDDAIDATKEAIKEVYSKIIYSSSKEEELEIIKFIEIHESEMYLIWETEKLEKIEKKIKILQEEKEKLEKSISYIIEELEEEKIK